jgi:hypothetical protein
VTPGGWADFNDRNVRSAAHTRAWVTPLLDHLVAARLVDAESTVLDYGCGAFDLGVGLAGRCARVDGFDVHPGARALAGRRAATLPAATIHQHVGDIPDGRYDLVVASSVIQYLDEPALDALLARCAAWMTTTARSRLLLADVLPPDYAPYRDALDSIATAARGGFLGNMLGHLARSALHGHATRLQRHAPEALLARLERHGYLGELLPRNLTPSRRRYSILARRRASRS